MNDPLGWTLFIVLLIVYFVIGMVRVSVVNARLTVLIGLREQGFPRVERAIVTLESPYLRPALRFALAALHFLLAGCGLWLLLAAPGLGLTLPLALLIVFGGGLVVMLVEFMLDGLVLRNVEEWAIRLSVAARAVDILLRPFSWLLVAMMGSSAAQLRRFNIVTEDELKNWVETEETETSLEKGEREMIASIFDFGDTLCREIMVPRIDVVALDVNTPLPEAIMVVRKYGHSRIPVYEDTIDNILGLLYAKDLLRVSCDEEEVVIREILRPAYFVPESKKVDELLREMQVGRQHLAVVVDEYGGTAGLVTLEDIVEEIVGEIRDEYDQGEELVYQQLGEDEYLFQGRIDVDDLNEILDTHLTREVADTLGGIIYGEIGRVPADGERVALDGWVFTVEQIVGQRIRKVRARKAAPEQPEEGKLNETER